MLGTRSLNTILLLILALGFMESKSQKGVVEKPLTDLDIQLVRRASAPAISVTGDNGESCLLTQRFVPAGGSECTWREQRICTLKPSVRSIPIFPSDCSLQGEQGVRLRNCKEVTRTSPAVESVRVCSRRSKEECPQPCPDCPNTESGDIATHCRKREQIVCSRRQEVRREVELSGERRVERQQLEVVEECQRELVGQQCAPINCRFVDFGDECVTENKTVEITLSDRVCDVCKPRIAEQVSLKEVCGEGSTKRCEDAPIEQLWKKFCTASEDNSVEDLEKTQSSLNSLLDPVNELFDQSLRNKDHNEIEDDLDDNSSREPKTNIDSSIKFKFTSSADEKGTEEESFEKLETLPTRRKSQASVYFNQNYQYVPLLNSRTKDTYESDNTGDIVEKFIEEEIKIDEFVETLTVIDSPKRTTKSPQSTETTHISTKSTEKYTQTTRNVVYETERTPTPTEIDNNVSTLLPEGQDNTEAVTNSGIIELIKNQEETSTIKVNSEENVNVQIPLSLNEQVIEEQTPFSEHDNNENKKITKEDLLRSCLLFGKGCDFNLNVIDKKELDSKLSTASTMKSTTTDLEENSDLHQKQLLSQLECLFRQNCSPKDQIYFSTVSTLSTSKPTTTSQPVTTEEEKEIVDRKRPQLYSGSVSLLKCFFNNGCENNVTPKTKETTTTTPVIPSLSQRELDIEEKIRSRATDCFVNGIC